jgi:hypothetical protein
MRLRGASPAAPTSNSSNCSTYRVLETVDLSGVKLEDGVTFDFNTIAPDLRLLPPGGRIVLRGQRGCLRRAP